MKKQVFSLFAVVAAIAVSAQSPSPSWTISQNASFSVTSAGHRFLDAVDNNVVWLSGYDGLNATFNYNWYSRTTNGGTSYNSGNIFPDTNSYSLGNMEGIDANTAWVAAFQRSTPYSPSNPGGGVIYKTTNGGTTWTNATAAGMFTNTATSFCNWVTFLTPNDGVVNGDPVNGEFELWRTTNGGANWTQVPGANIPNPLTGEFCIVNLYAKHGSTNLWFGTNAGRVYRSTDAGLTWSVSLVATTATITELAFSSPSNGIILAANSATAGNTQLYNTTDGGATWNLVHNLSATQASLTNVGRNDLCDIPGTGCIASVDNGNGKITYSKNNGATWTDWGSTGIGYVCIDFANSYSGWSGSFSDATTASVGGIWKYNGTEFISSFSIPSSICRTTGNVTVSPVNNSAGAPPLTFSWSAIPAGVVFSSATASVPVITFSANGTYTVSLQVTTAGGPSTSTQVVNVLSCVSPVANFTFPSTGCNNITYTLVNTTTGAPSPTYTLSTTPATNVTITPIASTSNYQLKFGTPGTYTVDLLASNLSGTNNLTQVVTINDCIPVPDFSLSTNFACRVLDSVFATNLTPGSGITYSWSVSGSTNSYSIFAASNPNDKKFLFPAITSTIGSIKYTITLKATNGSGSATKTDTVRVYNSANAAGAVCVGIFENSNLERILSVYPNPAHDQLNLILPVTSETLKITLTNVLGSVIYDEKAVNKEKHTVSLSSLPKGVYLLTVRSNNEKATRKIIVE